MGSDSAWLHLSHSWIYTLPGLTTPNPTGTEDQGRLGWMAKSSLGTSKVKSLFQFHTPSFLVPSLPPYLPFSISALDLGHKYRTTRFKRAILTVSIWECPKCQSPVRKWVLKYFRKCFLLFSTLFPFLIFVNTFLFLDFSFIST